MESFNIEYLRPLTQEFRKCCNLVHCDACPMDVDCSKICAWASKYSKVIDTYIPNEYEKDDVLNVLRTISFLEKNLNCELRECSTCTKKNACNLINHDTDELYSWFSHAIKNFKACAKIP